MPITRNYDYYPACIRCKEEKYYLEVFGIIFAQEGDTVTDHEWFKNRPGYFLEEHRWTLDTLEEVEEEINKKFREEVIKIVNMGVNGLFE